MNYDADAPRHYQVRIAEKAQADLENIYAFVAVNSESGYIAERQVDLIEKAILRLGTFPNGCPRYADDSRYRVRHFKKYCIFFEVDEAAGAVDIVRIFHARQDY